jgi:hypothetical protein
MRRVVVVFLLMTSGARASVLLPADVVTDGNAPAAVWQLDVAAGASEPTALPSDMLGFSVPPASSGDQAPGQLPSSVVPDVTSWTLLLLGMAIVGLAARRRQRIVTA